MHVTWLLGPLLSLLGVFNVKPLGEINSLSISLNNHVQKTYQAVKSSSKKVHSTHLHATRGWWWGSSGGGRCQVQIEKISQQVSLGWDDSWRGIRNCSSRSCVRALTLPTGKSKGGGMMFKPYAL